MSVMESLTLDIRFAFRTFTKRPGLTALVLALMVSGTALNTAVFSIVNAALIRPMSGNFERLVVVSEAHPLRGSNAAVRPANFFDWKSENRVFESATSARSIRMDLEGGGEPERLDVQIVLEDFFAVLGVPPWKGRTFENADYEKVVGDATRWDAVSGVAVLSYPFWQRQFGGDPAALGKTLVLDRDRFEIIGIMPRYFQGWGGAPALWLPWAMPAEERHDRRTHLLFGIASLKKEVTVEEAQSELDGIYQRLRDRFPDENRDWSVELRSFRNFVLGDARLALLVLLTGVLVVLVIACANVAGLLLSVGADRKKELAVRRAIGASEWRILRQFMTESLLLAAAGGALSLIAAAALAPLLGTVHVPTVTAFTFAPRLDSTVLFFLLAVSCAAGVLSGLAPSFWASRQALPLSMSVSRKRPGMFLVLSETALATALLIGGGLLLRSFLSVQRQDPGFDPEGLLTMEVALPRAQQDDPDVARAFQESLLELVRAIPGVRAAATSLSLPLERTSMNLRFEIPGRPSRSSDDFNASADVVSDEYFRTIGATFAAGRGFGPGDTQAGPGAIVINETMAREYWPNESAIGKSLAFPYPDMSERTFTVIGIVRDVVHDRLEHDTRRTLYLSQRQEPFGDIMLIVRTDGDPLRYVDPLKERIHEAAPPMVVSRVAGMDAIARESLRGPRLWTSGLFLFAALAVFLAVSGLYGLLAHDVSLRTREIGVRVALGADRKSIVRLVVGRGLTLATMGTVAGMVLAVFTTRFLASILYGLSPNDPATFAATCTGILILSALAAYLPARRAASITPTMALRYE
jgi:putative ABC transport system permease protein